MEEELSLLYVGLGIVYFVPLVVLGIRTFREASTTSCSASASCIPVLWIVGAILPPKGMSDVDELYARRDETG